MKLNKKNILMAAALCFGALPFHAQSTGQNYVKEETMLNASKSQKTTMVQYYDGYSRPVLQAGNGTAGGGKYTFALTTYDALGRISESWLPAVGGTTGDFLSASSVQSLSNSTYGESYAYSRNHYDALGRTTSVDGIGSAWRSAGKKVSGVYSTNTSDDVRKYTATSGSTTLSYSACYSSGTLSVETVTDEDGKTHAVYKDATGKTVLERSAGNYDTYYVYDDMDRLRFVLPPCASDALASTGSWSMDSHETLADYAYYYEYDGRGRCTKKKLPGAVYVLYEYDDRGRMTFSQDGNQRTDGQWTYYLYDGLNRLTEKGVCSNKSLTSKTAHIVNYYDSYDFVGTTGFSGTYYPSGDSYGTGKLTGSVITVFDSGQKIYRAHYYDAKGNVTKTVESNLMGGYDTTTSTYSFTDKPLTVTHAVANGAINFYLTEVYTYTYDSLDRPTKIQHTLGDTTVTLAEYTYDSLGRTSTKKVHGNTTNQLAYTYNVRGWLESITGTKFTQNLYYTTGNGTACYNGNISSMTWKSGDESTLRGYKYTYDAMNRLTAGNYGEGSTLSSNVSRYTESVGQYDKNGNISAGFVRNGLLSTGSYGTMNALVMTLDGNRLQAVRDMSGSTGASGSFEFVDGVTQTTEYAYDNNGNLTQDLNKGISNISYNVLSLPSVVTFSDGSTVTYCYDAEGRKQKVTYNITGETALHRTYSNGLLYENNVPKQLLTTEGYVDLANSNTYYYYLKDHQGNNRVVVNGSGTVQEVNHYYPFGGVFSKASGVQRYKYNGKELDFSNGLDWYDYGARHYDPTIARFTTMDPLAEKDYFNSAYNYCGNNPVIRIDKDGKIWDTVWDIGNVLYDIGAAVVSHISGDHEKAQGHWADAGVDAVAMAIPFVPAGASKVVKIAEKSGDIGNAMVRGRKSEAKVLQEIGEVKNTVRKNTILPETNEIVTTIPDAINDTKIIEIKDVKKLSNTKQIRAERQVAKDEGKTLEIITGEKTHVSKNILEEEIVRRKDLGPQ